jgi:glutaredoxin-like protein NrdH
MIELDCLEQVLGSKSEHDLVLFALSTCPHCRNARNFLDNNDLAYRFVYLDLLKGDEQKNVLDTASKYNPRKSFPTLVVDDDEVLVGFTESEWKAKLL